MQTLTVIGGGPGSSDYFLPAAVQAMEAADIIIADQRYVSVIPGSDVRPMGKVMAAIEDIREMIQTKKIAVVVSGDPLMYSLYKTIKRKIPEAVIHVIPGIGSMQMMASKLGETVENAVFLSAHGRSLSEGQLALNVYEHEKVFMLCDQMHDPAWAAKALLKYGLGQVEMASAENLSYENERWHKGRPEDMLTKDYGRLCVVMIKNPAPEKCLHQPLLSDQDFIRGKTPMTKEEVRWTILGKLNLRADSVVWDIGAGTGSVSVECARQCSFGRVFSVERNQDALALIQKNKEKFNLGNLEVIPGDAMEVIRALPVPTHVFIGGSGRKLPELMSYIASLGPGIKVMAACVTVETLSECCRLMQRDYEDFDLVQLCVSRGRKLGNYHILDSNNPVSLVWAVTP